MNHLNSQAVNDETHFLFTNPWGITRLDRVVRDNNVYICLTGNSGVGKSTLLKSIATSLFKHDEKTIAIDEKAIHHPFLQSLFCDTKEYGFQVQLNFMIQRSLLVKRWLDLGYNLVMERSHLEDRIFIDFLLEENCITNDEHTSYIQIWESVGRRLPQPDVMILLDYPVEFSLKNIANDEATGVRPREFPDEATKERWIGGWGRLYSDFFEKIKREPVNNIFKCHPGTDIGELTGQIMACLQPKLGNKIRV